MLNKIDKLDKKIKKWEDLSKEDKQAIAIWAGLGAGLLLRGIRELRRSKKQMEVINLVVPKDCELMIFVKGGK